MLCANGPTHTQQKSLLFNVRSECTVHSSSEHSGNAMRTAFCSIALSSVMKYRGSHWHASESKHQDLMYSIARQSTVEFSLSTTQCTSGIHTLCSFRTSKENILYFHLLSLWVERTASHHHPLGLHQRHRAREAHRGRPRPEAR